LQEEPTGNKLLVGIIIQQQLKLMELYGVGDIMVKVDWVIIQQETTDPFQSLHS
jgi:hypothetical protein